MSGLIRRVVIFAAADGLVLQAHGPIDHHKLLRVDYRTAKITPCGPSDLPQGHKYARLESHGVIGIITLFSFSYLLAVSRREQVAQIFGKPVYVITDVAIVPLGTQQEATKAIESSALSQERQSQGDSDSDSDADVDVPESKLHPDPPTPIDPPEGSSTPTANDQASQSRIVENVFTKRGQYGRFASQWFSRKGWGLEKKAEEGFTATPPNAEQIEKTSESVNVPGLAQPKQSTSQTGSSTSLSATSKDTLPNGFNAFMPKILRTTTLMLSSRCFYFSYEVDITRNLRSAHQLPPDMVAPDPLYTWNFRLASPFSSSGNTQYALPIMQGFVGQRSFAVKSDIKNRSHSVIPQTLELEEEPVDGGAASSASITSPAGEQKEQAFLLTVISRRSTKRSGLRYLRRGIDDDGNCANFVETEQILTSNPWSELPKVRSFLQIRGSVPIYFTQTPYSFKPVPILHQSEAVNQKAFKKHFQRLQNLYGDVQISLLVDRHGGEVTVGDAYETATKTANESGDIQQLKFDWFDFHHECRGMKFENVQHLVDKLDETIQQQGESVFEFGKLAQTQTGIIRSNCMDCLDRTNVVQSAFAQSMLQKDLQDMGYSIDLIHDESTQWFNTLWADNGDAISRAYAGSSALKGDYTRTRKRNYRGALNDLGLTLTRYYNNIVNDYFAQAVIDFLLGNVSSKVFEDFETTMKSSDPGISISSIREAAIETSSKIVIQDPTEDLVSGWTMLTPAQSNSLRTLPFEEAVILLTDVALYSCKFDWNTEKVVAFEKIDLRSITKIKFGTYIISTLTSQEIDDTMNAGLVVSYRPSDGNMIRVNTRSLQNSPADGMQEIDGGTGIMSMLNPKPKDERRIMALKVISKSSEEASKATPTPLGLAEHISHEIERAALAGVVDSESNGMGIIETGQIISLGEARQRTSYLEHVQHSLKKLVWT